MHVDAYMNYNLVKTAWRKMDGSGFTGPKQLKWPKLSQGEVGTKILDVMMTKILSGYFWIPPPTIKKKAFKYQNTKMLD